MNKPTLQFVSVCSICIALLLTGPIALSSDDTATNVPVEEIEINKNSESGTSEDLWDQTKRKTSEAASAAAEYTEVQGTKILEGTKQGLAKGADAVATGSKKAWDATKEAGTKAADYTVEKATEVGDAISETFNNENIDAEVSDKSVNSPETN